MESMFLKRVNQRLRVSRMLLKLDFYYCTCCLGPGQVQVQTRYVRNSTISIRTYHIELQSTDAMRNTCTKNLGLQEV